VARDVPATVTIRALGTTATAALTDPAGLLLARARLVRELRALDLACSRFREDSELQRLNRSGGRPLAVGELLRTALAAALEVARMTGGLVDPTVGRAMRQNGYDRTFARVGLAGGRLVPVLAPAGRYEEIELDHEAGTVRVPPGVELDLGASAKALAADRIAAQIAADTGAGALVALGGDIAVAGAPPPAGWVVGVDDDHATPPEAARERVAIRGGGLASSGIRVRRWRTAAGDYHHIVDPRTGRPARGPWATVAVAAASCLDANAASTASIVLGPAAPAWLAERRLPARLGRLDGSVLRVAGWPAEEAAA
jgi:thiamine biosynthesis lipoprotein